MFFAVENGEVYDTNISSVDVCELIHIAVGVEAICEGANDGEVLVAVQASRSNQLTTQLLDVSYFSQMERVFGDYHVTCASPPAAAYSSYSSCCRLRD